MRGTNLHRHEIDVLLEPRSVAAGGAKHQRHAETRTLNAKAQYRVTRSKSRTTCEGQRQTQSNSHGIAKQACFPAPARVQF